jgi:hypothetical protein
MPSRIQALEGLQDRSLESLHPLPRGLAHAEDLAVGQAITQQLRV